MNINAYASNFIHACACAYGGARGAACGVRRAAFIVRHLAAVAYGWSDLTRRTPHAARLSDI